MAAAPQVPIVGIGASAGGIEALEGLFNGLPDDPGLGFVIVTHLSPQRESLLAEVVSRHTRLPVEVAEDGAEVRENRVYVAPAGVVLGMRDGRLTLTPLEGGTRNRKPIDSFFAALATDRRDAAAAIVLSGGDGDGTLGIKAIKEQGGLTLAQGADGHGPRHPSMPDSAIATGAVDFAIPVAGMGAKLVEFARGLRLLDGIAGGTEKAGDEADEEAGEAGRWDAARREIWPLLRSQVGHDFSGYKTRTFTRRVLRRMEVVGLEAVEDYVARLRADPGEAQALFRDLLINVTSFFRDEDAFELLERTVLPRLFEGRGADGTVRVWVPGCATGEEVYSIAMLLRERMATLDAVPRVQIFATDIDDQALGVARAARYPEALLDAVSPERRRRHFTEDAGSWVVRREVRDLCTFSPHSVIRDPPFSRIDLVSCRNLLIYFGGEIQSQVIPMFHYALRGGGYLFLGTSENVAGFADLFTPLERTQRIFRAREDVPASLRLPAMRHPAMRLPVTAADHPGVAPAAARPALRAAVEARLLDRHVPAHVVANREAEVVYYSAGTGRYLEAAVGMPSRQLLPMARKGLRFDLRTAYRETVESGRPATRRGVSVGDDEGRVTRVTITVEPLAERDGAEPMFLVLFTDEGPSVTGEEAAERDVVPTEHAVELERELRETRDRLQSHMEEYETAMEELKASNEELVSVNEEMQSTNEELESSKEEMQSLNEELNTVNAELNDRVEALDNARSDLENLFESTEVATVFLDGDLLIRSFTPSIKRIVNLLPGDRGRPITDLASRFPLSEIARDLAEVAATRVVRERNVTSADGGAHYVMRLGPYRSVEGVKGVVATFVDVTSLKHAEARQNVLIAELQHRTRNLIAVVDAIARRMGREGGGVEGFLPEFSQRLGALSRVQGMLFRAGDGAVPLDALLREGIGALATDMMAERVTLEGPEVPVRQAAVQAIALVVHELATNALKYGALAAPGGRLRVTWEVTGSGGDRRLRLEWVESGVRMGRGNAALPSGGFGRRLIERSLSHEFRGEVALVMGEDGARCTVLLPYDRMSDERGR